MGQGYSTPLQRCLDAVCQGREACVVYSYEPQIAWWATPFNLEYPVTPAAVLRPDDAGDVAGAVKCAKKHGFKIQARSGGHSYGNFGLGGADGAVMLDLRNLKGFSMDESEWLATVGAGMNLGELDVYLHKNGGRAIAHGTCPGVGIGGHATVGGLGPMSRMWGNTLDHVVEVEVVTSDGQVRRASEDENEDLFWAIRGAGASFGIVTEFTLRTHPQPGDVVEYSYSFAHGSSVELGMLYKSWQGIVGDSDLDRRFSSIFMVQPFGVLVTGTFYGTLYEYKDSGILDRLPGGNVSDNEAVMVTDWMGHLVYEAEIEGLAVSSVPNAFHSKSLAFRYEDLMDDDTIAEIFTYLEQAREESLLWTIMFNSEGGAVNDTPRNATSYPHRDKTIMYQSYGLGLPLSRVGRRTRGLIDGVHERILSAVPGRRSTYAGYVDGDVGREAAQELYWGGNLAGLREVKRVWDPEDVFANPQSVEPAGEDQLRG